MKRFFALVLLFVSATASANEAIEGLHNRVRPILEASEKPLPVFARTLVGISLPPLPTPGESSNPGAKPLEEVAALIVRRLSEVGLRVQIEKTQPAQDELAAVADIRSWLLRHTAYSNLIVAAYAEEMATVAIMKGLLNGQFTANQAKDLRRAYRDMRISPRSIVGVAEALSPDMASLKELGRRYDRGERPNLISFAMRFAAECRESEPEYAPSVLKRVNVSGMLASLGWSLALFNVADGLIEFTARGGRLELGGESLIADLAKRVPDLFEERKDPVTGTEVSPEVFAGGLREIVGWKRSEYLRAQ